MTPAERLIERLRAEHGLDIPAGARVRRTYAGWAQRSQGALSWYLVDTDGRDVQHLGCTIGSHTPAGDLVRAHRIDVTVSRLTCCVFLDPATPDERIEP